MRPTSTFDRSMDLWFLGYRLLRVMGLCTRDAGHAGRASPPEETTTVSWTTDDLAPVIWILPGSRKSVYVETVYYTP